MKTNPVTSEEDPESSAAIKRATTLGGEIEPSGMLSERGWLSRGIQSVVGNGHGDACQRKSGQHEEDNTRQVVKI